MTTGAASTMAEPPSGARSTGSAIQSGAALILLECHSERRGTGTDAREVGEHQRAMPLQLACQEILATATRTAATTVVS